MNSIIKFRQDIEKQFGWNAAIGFWYQFVYQQYKRKTKDYEAALKTIGSYKGYTGV